MGDSGLLATVGVAVGVPLAFLWFVRRLDLYAVSGFPTVVRCLVWGAVAFAAALQFNTATTRLFALSVVVTVVAPAVEELFKSVVLVAQVRRPTFTYFVDGAVLGFATGIGFAIPENLFKVAGMASELGLGLAVNRALSATLMHATTSAIVGVALGRFRFGRGPARAIALVAGLAVAIGLHAWFNRWVTSARDPLSLLAGAILFGLAGVAVVALLVRQGLAEERRWLRETLTLEVGVTPAENAAVQELANLRTLLQPIGRHFGQAKQERVEALLRCQAQLGLRRKAAAMTGDPALRAALAAEVASLRGQMDGLQREIGVYCMAYLRAIWPGPGAPLWDRLTTVLAAPVAPGHNVWHTLETRVAPPAVPPIGPPAG